MASSADLLAVSVAELRRRIVTKEISPVEFVDTCIERIGGRFLISKRLSVPAPALKSIVTHSPAISLQ